MDAIEPAHGEVGIIERSTLSTLFQTLGRTWRSQEPEEIETMERRGEFERPKRFERLSYWALAEGYISPAKAMELLNKPLSEIEEGYMLAFADIVENEKAPRRKPSLNWAFWLSLQTRWRPGKPGRTAAPPKQPRSYGCTYSIVPQEGIKKPGRVRSAPLTPPTD